MRRKKQELSKEECIDILQTAKTAVLGVVGDNGYPYTVPINFVYANAVSYTHLDVYKRQTFIRQK